MKALIFVALLLINITFIECGFFTKCEISRIDEYEWLGIFTRPEYVEDVHEGLVGTYTTRNILEMTEQSSRYLRAVFENETLSIYTNEKFKDFEDEYEGSNEISLEMIFKCIEDEEETLNLIQRVKDTNNHDPVLNQDIYEYHFGMPLPENYDLTKFIFISANDADFSNRDINFTIGYNHDVVVQYHGESSHNFDDFNTSLKTLREIKGPFRQEYNLIAIDGGEPPRDATACLIVTVVSDESDDNNESNGSGDFSHPPIFEKHLYFATYTSDHGLKLEKQIIIKIGAGEHTIIKQSRYEEYFQASLGEPKSDGYVLIKAVKPLPKYILETTELLIFEIEAENEDFPHTPGRTALIIRLPARQKHNSSEFHKNCNNSIHSINFQNSNNAVMVLFYIGIILIIVTTNVVVLTRHIRKRKLNNINFNNVPMVIDKFKQGKSIKY